MENKKKYRLKKEYPGSPKKDFILDISWSVNYPSNNYLINGLTFNPENHKEYWEEIIEKDYEILSFKLINSSGSGIRWKNKYGMFPSTDVKNYESRCNEFSEERLLNDNYYFIHSVKRLSDGEVFTVGDKLDSKGWFGNLVEIKIINNKIKFFQQQHINSEQYKPLMIEELAKFKQPLFTTEDGVDIFEDDKIYSIDRTKLMFKDIDRVIQSKYFKTSSVYIYFSTKEKAEEYIIMNKPCLSIKDLKDWGDLAIPALKELVKTKLKL